MVELNKSYLLVTVAVAPFIALLFRGVVWGADSFAFMAVACGQTKYANFLSSPVWFTNALPFFSCNLFLIAVVMFIFYFLALISLKLLGDFFGFNGFLFVLFVGSLTPLFFVESIRFENDFFGWTLAFVSLGLILLSKKRDYNISLLFLAILCAFISINLWFPSIFILFIAIYMFDLSSKIEKTILIIGILISLTLYHQYLISSFTMLITTPQNLIAEEIPFVGLAFIIHLITFVNYIPKKLLPYSLTILAIGLIKAKYIFLSVPFLIMGLMKKDEQKGIYIKQDRIPLVPIAFLCLIGLTLTIPFLYPVQSDIEEMKQAIKLSNDLNLELKNDWGDGWVFVFLGKETPYKISNGAAPDFNTSNFVAYTKKSLDCNQISQKIFIC